MDDDRDTTTHIDLCPCGGTLVTELQQRTSERDPRVPLGESRCTTPERHPSGGV